MCNKDSIRDAKSLEICILLILFQDITRDYLYPRMQQEANMESGKPGILNTGAVRRK